MELNLQELSVLSEISSTSDITNYRQLQLKNLKFKYRNLKRAYLKTTKICQDQEKKIQEQNKLVKALIKTLKKYDIPLGHIFTKEDIIESTQKKRYKSVNYLNQKNLIKNDLVKSENLIQQTNDENIDGFKSTFQQLIQEQKELQKNINQKEQIIDNKSKIITIQNQEINHFINELRNLTTKLNKYQVTIQNYKENNDKYEQTITLLQNNLQNEQEKSNNYEIQKQQFIIKFEKTSNELKKFQDQIIQSDDKALIFNAQLDTNFEKHKVLLLIRKNYYDQQILEIESKDNEYQILFKNITRIEKTQNNKIRIFQNDYYNKQFIFKFTEHSQFYESFQKIWQIYKNQNTEIITQQYQQKGFFKKLSNIFFQLIYKTNYIMQVRENRLAKVYDFVQVLISEIKKNSILKETYSSLDQRELEVIYTEYFSFLLGVGFPQFQNQLIRYHKNLNLNEQQLQEFFKVYQKLLITYLVESEYEQQKIFQISEETKNKILTQ